ncbi:hypothetical protein F4825DRAFT_467551 [Nemania diffusa]|nr:hypothetical protein F4825DRAFT_467551 [Nemania diffusa]
MAGKRVPRELNREAPAPPPPAYEAINSHPPEPGPATGGRFYNEDKQNPSIHFKFCPDPSKIFSLRAGDWAASLQVKCSDVPRLMREGFHWNASNVIKEDGYIENRRDGHKSDAWESAPTRWYFLADTCQPRRWTASLMVKASDVNILYNFDVSQLSREVVRYVQAVNQEKQEIYSYQAYTAADKSTNTAEAPMIGFNMIYDKMPMEGFWPWPRKENEAHTKDHIKKCSYGCWSVCSRTLFWRQ